MQLHHAILTLLAVSASAAPAVAPALDTVAIIPDSYSTRSKWTAARDAAALGDGAVNEARSAMASPISRPEAEQLRRREM